MHGVDFTASMIIVFKLRILVTSTVLLRSNLMLQTRSERVRNTFKNAFVQNAFGTPFTTL